MFVAVFTLLNVKAQEIDFGVSLSYYLNSALKVNEKPAFHFADDVNTSLKIDAKDNLTNSYFAAPNVYLSYWLNNHLALKYTLGYYTFAKKDDIIRSNSNIYDYASKVKYKFDFVFQSFDLYYYPIKTREVQPYLGIGIETRYNISMKEVSPKAEENLLVNESYRGQIVDAQIRSIKKLVPAYKVIIGFNYYVFDVSMSYSKSIGNIQEDRYVDYYNSFSLTSLNVGIRLYHRYHKSSLYHIENE